ncbi:conserved Plasmodium protein, unknown function [Plasmodium malariae]|uniref:Uncharacterized protein n=1 Tax=Plasmodium malariae TaxID=5858 RepID=A0A1D3JMN5_PLAMA|nr:conserved Plasmodium protein, unknown function [Plasmodium malariae]SBT87816.1 conserved Plasmodium protein, unknown function [Plasmodium malariae]
MLFYTKENELKKKVISFLLLLILYEQCLINFIYSFSINKRTFVLNSVVDKNDNVKKNKLRENRKILVEIGNSLREQDVHKSLANLDSILTEYSKDKRLSKNMSVLCGNVLNLCSKFNDINNMIKVIEKMKYYNIEMQENSYLAICNYYISNNYIYEYLLTINKMIERNITIRERFYKYILVHILDLSFDNSGYARHLFHEGYTNNREVCKEGNAQIRDEYIGSAIRGGQENSIHDNVANGVSSDYNGRQDMSYYNAHYSSADREHSNNKRYHLIKNTDYSNFDKYTKELNKYNMRLDEEDKKYILNNYLLIDIFKHMNDNEIKIKLIYILKLVHYVYENIQYLMRKKNQELILREEDTQDVEDGHDVDNNDSNDSDYSIDGASSVNSTKSNSSDKEKEKLKKIKKNNGKNFYKDILIEQLKCILDLYKMNYDSMNINIKKYEETLDEQEKRNVYYQVNKIIKKLPFIKLTENVKNTYKCKNCEQNINTYFLTLKQIIIVIVNIILITNLFNNKEIYKIKHFFSILNRRNDEAQGKEAHVFTLDVTKNEHDKGEPLVGGPPQATNTHTENEQQKIMGFDVLEEVQKVDQTDSCKDKELTCVADHNALHNIAHSTAYNALQNASYNSVHNSLIEAEMNKHFEKGSYTCLLDGANIGYNKQNVENGRFSFLQIEVLKEIIKKKNKELPLIILPKIYHYKNSLKHLRNEGIHSEQKTNANIFIPNKTIKIKKYSPTCSVNSKYCIKPNKELSTDRSGDRAYAEESGIVGATAETAKEEAEGATEGVEEEDSLGFRSPGCGTHARPIFNKLDSTDVEIIKKWEKEKCLYICNYNMYDDYYYILGSLARSNNLFNIYYYIDELSKHFYKYKNLNHNVIIDNYSLIDDRVIYNNREVLHIYNSNLIFDRNSNIMVLVSDENINKENKYISMNEQYYNDKIKKKKKNFKLFDEYKSNFIFKDKDNIRYVENIYADTYFYDSQKGEHIIVNDTNNKNKCKTKCEKLVRDTNYSNNTYTDNALLKSKTKQEKIIKNYKTRETATLDEVREKAAPDQLSASSDPNSDNNVEHHEKTNFYYANIYIKCVKNVNSAQKPIYVYTNDKMKNHYFNEYTNFILKKWKKKSFISFYFKQPIILSELRKQSDSNTIDLTNIINNYKLPYVNLENSKLYIDDIISYKDRNIYHIKINSPSKTFLSYQSENIPFLHYNNNVVKYLCIDFSRI